MDTGVEGRKASRVGVRVSAVSKTIKGNRVLDGVSASFPLAREWNSRAQRVGQDDAFAGDCRTDFHR